MNYPFKLDPELIPILKAYTSQPAPPEGTSIEDSFRQALIYGAIQNKAQSTDNVTVKDKYFINSDGVDIQLRVYTPVKVAMPRPCLYWMHGGGTMSGLPEQDDQTMYQIALAASCVVVSVNYRLAPENPYPTPINDCYEGLEYIYINAPLFTINRNKIAVGGGSAGGMLAASCSLLSRERNGPPIVHQSLTYPMLDHRGITKSSHEITNVGVWDRDMNLYGWQCYLKNVKETTPDMAIPGLVDDLSGLPPTFLAVGTMDVLRDEGIAYAQKLAASGVTTELHLYPGMVHVFDALIPESTAAKDFNSARISALKRAFES